MRIDSADLTDIQPAEYRADLEILRARYALTRVDAATSVRRLNIVPAAEISFCPTCA